MATHWFHLLLHSLARGEEAVSSPFNTLQHTHIGVHASQINGGVTFVVVVVIVVLGSGWLLVI